MINADGLVDLYMQVGALILDRQLFNMTQSISLPYQRSTGSAFPTTLRTLDTLSLVTLLGEARYSVLGELTPTRAWLGASFLTLSKAPSIALQTHLRKV